jgi:hypothetical protein
LFAGFGIGSKAFVGIEAGFIRPTLDIPLLLRQFARF